MPDNTLRIVNLPDRCANAACPNRPGEGKFVLLETAGPVVGGHRPLRLWVCSPCSMALAPLPAMGVRND